MDAICYVCNKQSTDWCQNLVEIKSQHTQTPIVDFLRRFLGAFESLRNIDDESNCICVECLQQIDDYDWMRQQASERETKLCDLLLSTEIKLRIESSAIEENIGDCHNDVHVQQPTPQASISSSMSNNTSNRNPTLQSNHTGTFVKISEPSVKQNRILIRKPGQFHSIIVKSRENQMQTVSQAGNEILISTTTEPSSTHQNNANGNSTTPSEYAKPAFPYTYLIATALKNSPAGSLPTSEICSFICEHFPYFQTTIKDWKRSISNQLAASECFVKMELQIRTSRCQTQFRSKNVWAINPSKMAKLDKDIEAHVRNYETNIRIAMAVPDNLPALVRGELKCVERNGSNLESDNANHSALNELVFHHDAIYNDGDDCDDDNGGGGDESDVFNEIDIDDYSTTWNELGLNPEDCNYYNDSTNGDVIDLYEQQIAAVVPPASRPSTPSPAMLSHISIPLNLTEPVLQSNPSRPSGQISKPKVKKMKKPNYSYRYLAAMALKSSRTGSLPVAAIYSFICDNFPYFNTAPSHWKNSVRHTLCQSNWFEKIIVPDTDCSKKHLWAVKKSKMAAVEVEFQKFAAKNSFGTDETADVMENDGGSLSGSYIELDDDTGEYEPDNRPDDSTVTDRVENIEAEYYDNDVFGVFDEIDTDGSKLFQFELVNTEDGNQFESADEDLEPMEKRARFDIN